LRLGTRHVRNLYRAGLIKTVASEQAKYNVDFVAVQKVRWDKVRRFSGSTRGQIGQSW